MSYNGQIVSTEKRINNMPESNKINCQDSDMPVVILPEFTNVHIKGDVNLFLKKIGDSIVYIEGKGSLKNFELEKYNLVIEDFCAVAGVKAPYVQIINFENITGRLKFGNMKKQMRLLYEHQNTMIGFVLIEEPSWLKPFIIQGLRFFKPSFWVASVSNYADAIAAVKQVFNNKNLTFIKANNFDSPNESLSFKDVIFKPEWEYNNPNTGISYRIGAIPGHLHYISMHGKLSLSDDIINAGSLLEKVVTENRLTGIHYIVVNYSELAPVTSIGLRLRFAKEAQRINASTGNHNAVQIAINPDRINRSAIKLFAPFIKQDIIIVNSIEEAFEWINNHSGTFESDNIQKDIYVSSTDLEEISNAFAVLQMDESGKIPETNVSANNPLAYLAESLELIKSELNDLRENERRLQEERLQESETSRMTLVNMMEDIYAAKSALEKEEESKRILLDNIHTQVWYLTDDHTYGAVNKAHADFFGVKTDDLAFMDIYDLFPKEVADVCRQGNKEVFTTGKPVQTEEWIPHRSGEQRLISVLKSPRMHPNGTVEYVVCSAEDITERKKAEEALSASEANFRAFFGSMQDMVVVGSPDGRVLYANNAIIQKLGYSLEELNELGIIGIHPPELRQEAAEIVAAMFRGERNSCPLPVQSKDGVLVPVESRVSFGKWNGINCIFGISKDISAELDAQQRFEHLFRNNPAPMALSSLPDHRFIDVNDAFTKTLGYSRAEVVGKNVEELRLFPDPEQQKSLADRLPTEGRITDFELKTRAKDGSLLDGLYSGEIIRSQNQQFTLTVMIDITDRKRAEEQIKLQNKKLNELNATKDKFFSIIAHDLKSPFNSIMGFSELLADQIRKNDYQGIEQYAGIILHSSQRAMELLMNLLEWSRSQTGRIEFNPEYFELIDLIKETLVLFVDVARQKSITIKKELPHNIPAYADKPMISTVMRNLISNAIKFTRQGGEIIIKVNAEQNDIVVSVSDNGVGIPKTRLEKLFRIGQSESTPGTASEHGTGLGLILCKEFIENHGGKIWVESKVEKGSIFNFTIPNF